ncbi:MAG: hypothetical protein ACE5EC_10095 [Phycisphaerae bacterium]
MERRTRNRICIYIIFFGLLNYVFYGFMYAYIQGDARNGGIIETQEGQLLYYVSGHHITKGIEGKENFVSSGLWIYSYIHSISLWPTHAAILIAMFILARPHILATMKEDAWLSGPSFVTMCMTLVVLIAVASTGWFLLDFIQKLHRIASAGG